MMRALSEFRAGRAFQALALFPALLAAGCATHTVDVTHVADIRYKPSNVEVHMKDTDIMYVVKGSATIVTGVKLDGIVKDYKLANGSPAPKDEIRAANIVGGDARNLSAGDMIIIPNGVGHQFTKVDGPFMYIVVKCR